MRYVFQLTTVSELFVGGANQPEADLKPSTFANEMRFWFRAMMGAVVGDDLAALKQLETLAFGSTGAGSSMTIRLVEHCEPTDVPNNPSKHFGYEYLAFSVKSRQCIPVGQTFKVSIDFRYQNTEVHYVVLGAMWLLLHFGGVGARSRRTFGALSGSLVAGDCPLLFNITGNVIGYYETAMSQILHTYRDFAARHCQIQPVANLPNHTSFQCFSCRIATSPNWTSVFSLQEDAGRLLRGFRNGTLRSTPPANLSFPEDWKVRTQDYLDVVSPFLGPPHSPPSADLINDVLGLPIETFSSSRQKQGQRPWKANTQWRPHRGNEGDWNDRRASPLFLHPIKTAPNRHALVLVVFFAPFLPPNSEMRIKTDSTEHAITPVPSSRDVLTMAKDLFTLTEKWFPNCRGVKLVNPSGRSLS